jgi:hypothetical protein
VDGPGDLDHQPAHADDPAVDLDPVNIANLLGKGFQGLLAFTFAPSSFGQPNTGSGTTQKRL